MANGDLFSLSGMYSPVQIVDQVISQAIKMQASDILFEPQDKNVIVRLRVDGALQKFGQMAIGSYEQVLARIKVVGNMDVAENWKPQENKISLEVDGHPYALRVEVVTTNFGQMAALRVLDMPQFVDFQQLGMSTQLADNVKKSISGRYGLFLVCGPTGAGKTTTVHSCLKYLNNEEVNIVTIEDPVEYIVPGLNQIEVGRRVGLDFVSGLKTMLRLNPDIVFVGEIRDAETAKIAIQASLTGHLVISTIHARGSVGALYRLLNLGVDKYMLNYALRGVLSQRLMRRVCEKCKEIYTPTSDEIEQFTKINGQPPGQLMHGKGCDECHNSRYKGRVGIYEFLNIDDTVRRLVLSGADESQFGEELAKNNWQGMDKDGLRLVGDGVTSIREYFRTMYDAK